MHIEGFNINNPAYLVKLSAISKTISSINVTIPIVVSIEASDNYEHLFNQDKEKLKPIIIGNNISLKSINSFDNNIFDDVFEDTNNIIDFHDLKDMSLDLVDTSNEHQVTLKTNSTLHILIFYHIVVRYILSLSFSEFYYV